jgi:coenzyme PQQ synthesis protein D (PqqD)
MRQAIVVSKQVRCISDDDGAVLLDLKGGKYFSLNSLGAKIWRLLEQRWTRAQIEQEIVENFDVSSMTAAQDLERFLRDLQQKGFVSVQA